MESELQALGLRHRQPRLCERVCGRTGEQCLCEHKCVCQAERNVCALPFRCPRCGESARFRSLASLRAHLRFSHTFPSPPVYQAPPLTTPPNPNISKLSPAPSSFATVAEAPPPPLISTEGSACEEAGLRVRLWVALWRAEQRAELQLRSDCVQWRHLLEEQHSLSRQVHTAAMAIASLRQQLSTSQHQLEQRESEAMSMQRWLFLASQHELQSKERLRSFMEMLLHTLQ